MEYDNIENYQEWREYWENKNMLAHTGRKTPDGYVPGGIAGFIVEECTVLCYECGINHSDVKSHPDGIESHEYSYDYLSGMSETDFPGHSCENCLKKLDTNIIFYD